MTTFTVQNKYLTIEITNKKEVTLPKSVTKYLAPCVPNNDINDKFFSIYTMLVQ